MPATTPHASIEPPRRASKAVRAAQRVVEDLFGPPLRRAFAVRYWDGTTEWPDGDARFTISIRRPAALRRMLLPPSELAIAEAYLYGDIDIEGDVEAAADLGDVAVSRIGSVSGVVRLVRDALALPSGADTPSEPRAGDGPKAHVARRLVRFGRPHTSERDARAVRFH